MPANVKIRPAKKDDCRQITNLTNQLGYPSSFEKVCQIVDLVLNHNDHQIYVAEIEDELASYVHLVCTMRISSDPFVEIAALVVHEDYRNRGIGKLILQAAQNWTIEKGYQKIRIRSNIIRQEAQGFFRQQGFSQIKTQNVFVKSINPDQPE